jgi:hypothetical protein
MHGYPFSFPTSGYLKPIGGHSRALIPGVLAIHSLPFLRVFLEIGGRATAIKLKTKDEGVLVFAPIPWGPEAQSFLKTLEPNKEISQINVKYLVAPDVEHHMALKSWKEQFPNAKIFGPEALIEKKKSEGITIDYAFNEADGKTLLAEENISTHTRLDIPSEIINEFDFAYFPHHVNKELVLLHKPTKTFLTADLFFNLPSFEQYEGSHINPVGGLSFLTKYLAIDSWLQRKVFGSSLPKKDYEGVLNAIYQWGFERIIPCHGEILEGLNVRDRFANLFEKYIKKTN